MHHSFRFFSRGKLRSKKRAQKIDEEQEIERIGVIPSVEDTTRTLPHWTVYIAWTCKRNISSYFIFIKFIFFICFKWLF